MFKKIIFSGLMSLVVASSALQLWASVGGDCTPQQLACCPNIGEPQLIHCQNMWNGDVFCAYDNDTVIDVTACAGSGGGSGSGETTEDDG